MRYVGLGCNHGMKSKRMASSLVRNWSSWCRLGNDPHFQWVARRRQRATDLSLVEQCWQPDPAHRPSFAAILDQLSTTQRHHSTTAETAI